MFERTTTEFISRRWMAVFLCVTAIAIQWGLICWYSDIGVSSALGISVLFILILTLGILFYRLSSFFLKSVFLRRVLILMVLLLDLVLTGGIVVLTGLARWEQFGKLIPLFLLYGGMGWMVTAFCFRKEKAGDNLEIVEEEEVPEARKQEILDRISVKKGSEIHIVKVGELRYIQADGDYVTLFTDEAKYLKEQTMKYFENRLPDNFVRIHRSCIVNVDEITRVELFGKESYHVKIKNGTILKASVAGYKSLKKRLEL